METTVDTLVYQLEDDDTGVRWNTLQKLRRIAAVETCHFPVRNTRRFLQCVRRRIVGETDPRVAVEALRLLGDVMVSLGDSVDQIQSSILPHLIPILPKKRKNYDQGGDSDDEADMLQEEMFQVFRKYTNATNDLQAVADLLVNIGLGSGHGSVREASLLVLMRLLDERFQNRTMPTRGESTRSSIGRGDKALIVALVQAIIPALEDTHENVVVAAEEAIAKLESYWGRRFSSDVMKFLSSEDKRTLHEHCEPIADFLQACIASVTPPPSPPTSSASSSSDMRNDLGGTLSSTSGHSPSKVHPLGTPNRLCFGFVSDDIVATLTTNTSNSNTDWKKRTAAVEKLYAACKHVDECVLRGLTAEQRAKQVDELEDLFDILIRLTQDVDVHLVKRALQITQILFRKLSPPQQLDHGGDKLNEDGDDSNEPNGCRARKDAAFYMTKMLAPMVETSANFAGGDDDMECFVYSLLGQVFASGCVRINTTERVLASTSLRHRRSQIREEAVKVWIVLLLIAERDKLLATNYEPDAAAVQTLGRLLGDTSAHVRDLAMETAAVLATVCRCNIYTLLETYLDDEYVSERVDWAALRARLRRKQVPELRSDGTLRLTPATTRASNASKKVYHSVPSVEQSLDGVSELRMMVAKDEPKSSENRRQANLSAEPRKPTKDKVVVGGSLSDRSYFNQQKLGADGDASSRAASSDEGGGTEDIGDKLLALKKKMDQLRQPRARRVRRPASQETVKVDSGHEHTEGPPQQMLPRSRSSPDHSAFNPADDGDHRIQGKDAAISHSSRDSRVHPGNAAATLPTSGTTFKPSQHSPQHLQSLQSEARNHEDRPLKSKFIERQREHEAGAEASSPTHSSPDERPIRPLATSGDPDEFPLHFLGQDSDNNETRTTTKLNGERVMSLATRKRLESKAKQDAQAGNASPTLPMSPRTRAREDDAQKPWKKPTKPKGADDADSKPRPSGKQEPRYLEPHEITPTINPKQELGKVLTQLQSEDWETNFDALSTVRRLAAHHASLIDPGKVHAIMVEILKQVPNLRSSVSKNALLALEAMCSAFSRAMDSEVEHIVPVLVKRCSDSNAFVCESASASFHTVVLRCSTARVVSALASHVTSKAAPIRREVARGIHALIAVQADGFQASKDLPALLQLVGRCLQDSNNEVRDVAKQCILSLHYKQHMSGDRIKRFLPASAQVKVDGVLSGKVAYVPLVLSSSSPSELSSPQVQPRREAPPPASRVKKTAKASSRMSPPASRTGARRSVDADELLRLETKLDSSNWKDRFDALSEATDFICGCAPALVESGQMLNLFDQLIKRLDDGNAKVNVLALECMHRIVPAVGSGMEQVLSNLVPVIAKNLANARTSALAQSVVQQLCIHADNRALCQQLAVQARSANSRVLPVLLDTLAQLTAQSVDDKGSNYSLTRHVLPVALDLLKEAKSSVKEANANLLRQLRRTLGPATVSTAASKLSASTQTKLAAALR